MPSGALHQHLDRGQVYLPIRDSEGGEAWRGFIRRPVCTGFKANSSSNTAASSSAVSESYNFLHYRKVSQVLLCDGVEEALPWAL